MLERAGEESRGEGRKDEVGDLTEFPPGKAVAEARVPRTAGGTGGREGASLPGGSLDPAPSRWTRDWKANSGSRAKGACPTPATAQGSRALLYGKRVCRGCGERRGRFLIRLLGAWEQWVPGRTPHPGASTHLLDWSLARPGAAAWPRS